MGSRHTHDGFAERHRLERHLYRRQGGRRLERHQLDRRISTSSRAGSRRTGASFSPSSFTGGVFGGANLQMGQLDLRPRGFVRGNGPQSIAPSPYFPATDTFKTEIDWLIFVEPRIGYSWDRTMVFVKGGWAGGNANLTATGPGNDASTSRPPVRTISSMAGPSAAASNTRGGPASSSDWSTATPTQPRHGRVVRPVPDRHSGR